MKGSKPVPTVLTEELQKEFETFIENINVKKLSQGLRNMLVEYLVQNAEGGYQFVLIILSFSTWRIYSFF